MQRLCDGRWLDGDLINFYLAMLYCVSKCRIYCASTYFFSEGLLKNDYASVKKWIKRVNIFDNIDKVLIPIHWKRSHWTLAVINVRQKQFEYYDSSLERGNPSYIFELLRKFVGG